jgi:glycerophosphoryl diester phosphodiesterase
MTEIKHKKFFFITAILAIVPFCQGSRPLVIAHRGFSSIAPENTTAAIELAWEKNIPAAECDIRLTSDNQVVLMHDPDTNRTASIDYVISETDYRQLSLLDVGSFKEPKYANERIPLLADIIDSVPSGRKLLIEIKCGSEVLPYLEKIINQSGKRNRIIIIGFNIDVVTKAKDIMPDIPTYWLVKTQKDKNDEWIDHGPKLINKAKDRKLDGLNVHWEGLNKQFVQEAHQAGLKVFTWTIDDVIIAHKVTEMGIDGLTSNKPYSIMKGIGFESFLISLDILFFHQYP